MVLHHMLGRTIGILLGAGARAAASAAMRRASASPSLPPNVERAEGGLRPAPGYDWVSAAPGDFAVRWTPGKPHPEHRVLAGTEPGRWHPAAGYAWVSPEDRESMEVRWEPGLQHPRVPHVVATDVEGKWGAASGYRWVSQEPGDLRVEPDGHPHAGGQEQTIDGDRLQRIKDLATLGLDEGAGWEAVEAAFRRLVKVHHPDRFAGAASDAVDSARRAFLLLRQAYDRLRTAAR